MTIRRCTAFVVATLVFTGLVSIGAGAPDALAQSNKDKRVEAARELKALQASDVQLSQAIKTLDAQVKQADVQTQSARQSVRSARIALNLAESRLHQAEAAMQRVRGQLVARALAEYKQQGAFDHGLGSGDISEAVRRRALLDHVTKVDNDVLDQLHATREDLVRQRAAAQRAKAVTEARERIVEQRLAQLVRDRASRGRLSAALEKRIEEVKAEAIALAGDDTAVRRILGSSGAAGGTVVGKTSRYGLQWPLKGRLTSGFGRRWGRLHAGIDIADPKGTPIHAAKAGTVVFAGQMRGYGNVVIIDHGGGLSTLYGHQSRLGSSRGQRVSQGQTIGYVGSTGHSTGNHLHFETRINGRPQNPRNFLP
jgi:murein DD-endopeptidase MepM/ murein hydrolase activator NlpD